MAWAGGGEDGFKVENVSMDQKKEITGQSLRNMNDKGTKRRRVILMDRDLKLLKFCYEQKFLLRRQVDEWFILNSGLKNRASCLRVARRQIGRLKQLGLLECVEVSTVHSRCYNVTSKGAKILIDHGKLPDFCRYFSLDQSTLNHDSLVTDVRFFCQKLGLFQNWIPDRFLKIERHKISPDAEAIFYSQRQNKNLTAAIEVEVTQKSKKRLRNIFYKYKTRPYNLVLYFVPDTGLLNSLKKLAGEYTPKIFFCVMDDFFTNQLEALWVNQTDSFVTSQIKKE